MPNLSLNKFMVFNSGEGRDESREHEKLLYHWTKETDDHQVSLAEQVDDVCLCDATINVSFRLNGGSRDHNTSTTGQQLEPDESKQTASKSKNIKSRSLTLYFDNTLVLIVQVEPKRDIWMAAHIADNSSSEANIEAVQQSNIDPHNFPADAIERVINNIYASFCLLNGNFHMIASNIEKENANNDPESEQTRERVRESLRDLCSNCLDNILAEIHLSSLLSNISFLYNYILYLDLNPLTLMTVNSFINHLVCLDAVKIRHTIVIFNDKLLWSSLSRYDTRILYNFLVSSLIKDALQDELSKEVDKVRLIADELPIYLTEEIDCYKETEFPSDIMDLSEYTELLAQGETITNDWRKFYMTVFRSNNNLTLGLILSKPEEHDLIQKCEQILTSDSRLGVVPMASLAQTVGQSFIKSNTIPTTSQGGAQTQEQSSSSFGGWKRQSGPIVAGSKNSPDQKYVLIDKVHASISWPFSMDIQAKDYLRVSGSDTNSTEHPGGRKLRLIKHLIELEPELTQIQRATGNSVEEFYYKGSNDFWLTINNCKLRSIYSVHQVRNSSLTEAQESAINLRSSLAG